MDQNARIGVKYLLAYKDFSGLDRRTLKSLADAALARLEVMKTEGPTMKIYVFHANSLGIVDGPHRLSILHFPTVEEIQEAGIIVPGSAQWGGVKVLKVDADEPRCIVLEGTEKTQENAEYLLCPVASTPRPEYFRASNDVMKSSETIFVHSTVNKKLLTMNSNPFERILNNDDDMDRYENDREYGPNHGRQW
jgi:hypothetical protein